MKTGKKFTTILYSNAAAIESRTNSLMQSARIFRVRVFIIWCLILNDFAHKIYFPHYLRLEKWTVFQPVNRVLISNIPNLFSLFQNKGNSSYMKSDSFQCLPCAEGCETCVNSNPCILALNWVLRSVILILSCIIIFILFIVEFFTWRYRNVKVSVINIPT